MENVRPHPHHGPQSAAPSEPPIPRKRSGSGSSILSRIPFMRSSESRSNLSASRHVDEDAGEIPKPPLALAAAVQQQKTRRRKGSLRKVALLGRGAQRERREIKPLEVEPHPIPPPFESNDTTVPSSKAVNTLKTEGTGLGITDDTPRPSMDGYGHRETTKVETASNGTANALSSLGVTDAEPQMASPAISYTSTTDEEDVLSIPSHAPALQRTDLVSLSSGSESYFAKPPPQQGLSLQRRRSVKQRAKSPLSLPGLATTPLPPPDLDHDYSETEWWGWVVLIVTWFVFIVGMGSCLGVWSWAWDVGTTPYASPELEDDPTLPITGYYPALIILTGVMAWVWVVIAWVGMKYFRHAKISGD